MQAKQPQPQQQPNPAVAELRQVQKRLAELTEEVSKLKPKLEKSHLSDAVAWGVFKGGITLVVLLTLLNAIFATLL